MKKVLILAYDFPPYVSVGGLRPYAWHQYFKEFGLYPIVVTRQWDNKYGNELDYIAPSKSKKTIIEETEYGTIIRTPYKPNLSNRLLLKHGSSKFKLLRKLITAYYEIMQFFFFIGTKSSLYYGAKKYLKNNKVDVILATGEPFVLFKYASKLSNKFNTPWIADYRDPWNPTKHQNILWQKLQVHFEKKYGKTASKIITVSDFCKKKIEQALSNQEFIISPNGYNIAEIKKIESIKQNKDILSFAFVGSIYKWNEYINVLKCFNQFLKDNPSRKIKLDFFGVNISDEIYELLNKKFINLKPYVKIYPKIPNQELLNKLPTYNIMLLLNYYSFSGTKIYDYLAIKRSILMCYSNDPDAIILKEKFYPQEETEGLSQTIQEDIINETNSGIVAKDYNHLYQILENLHNEFEKKGKIECNSINIEQYSRKTQTAKLANIILETISSKTSKK